MGVVFDPLAADYQVNPYPYFEVLREQPAVWVESLGAWFVGRHRDVRAMVSEPEVFSNRRFNEISKGEFDYAPGATQLVASDPPEHTRLRTLASYAFRPGRIREMKAALEEIAAAYIDPLVAARAPFDFHGDLASRIPIHAITRMLGVPASEGPKFREWTADILSASNRSRLSVGELEQIRRSVRSAQEYFLGVIEERRREPGEDMISSWIEAQEGGDKLTDGEILGMSILLLVGGDSTTAHLLSNAMTALWDHPDQLEAVRSDLSLVPKVIEEALRYESPVQTVFLTTTREVDLDGVTLPADAAVIGVWSSANRDPEVFERPDEFDIFREQAHMAFGFGPHFCLGSVLARAEAKIVLERVLGELPTLRRAGDGPIDWTPSYWIRGPRSLPVLV